ncbi:MAG: hypothetical protein WCF90_09500, partial [Methanomicrobiales archaeon]
MSRKYHKEIAGVLIEGLTDSDKLLEYATQLDDKGFSSAGDTIPRFHNGLMDCRSNPPVFWK